MLPRIILSCCLLLAISRTYAQQTINYSKSRVRYTLRSLCRSNDWPKNWITEGPHSMTLHINDSAFYSATFNYYFNRKGKCYLEQRIAYCDSCYRKYTLEFLDKKRYEWVKVNDTVYVSKYSRYRRLELHPATHTIDFFKTFWTEEEYARQVASR